MCFLSLAAFRPRAGGQPRLPPEDHPHQQRADAAGPRHQPGGRGEAHRLHRHRLPLRRHHPLRRAAQVRIKPSRPHTEHTLPLFVVQKQLETILSETCTSGYCLVNRSLQAAHRTGSTVLVIYSREEVQLFITKGGGGCGETNCWLKTQSHPQQHFKQPSVITRSLRDQTRRY